MANKKYFGATAAHIQVANALAAEITKREVMIDLPFTIKHEGFNRVRIIEKPSSVAIGLYMQYLAMALQEVQLASEMQNGENYSFDDAAGQVYRHVFASTDSIDKHKQERASMVERRFREQVAEIWKPVTHR